jgi:murein DD-endopeptidase MepM/ murein hydrolase activator NlpD
VAPKRNPYAFNPAHPDAKPAATVQGALYGDRLRQFILQRAQQLGFQDPYVPLAVVPHEGGLQGAIGDNQTSFGPWQLHRGGALPGGIANPQEWANSPAGINYALAAIKNAVGANATGPAAVARVVRDFERPAAQYVPGEIGKAQDTYRTISRTSSIPAADPTAGAGRGVPDAAPFGAAPTPLASGAPSRPVDLRAAIAAVLANATKAAETGAPYTPTLGRITPGAAPSFVPVAAPAPQQQVATSPAASAPYRTVQSRASSALPLPTPLGTSSEFATVDAEGAPDARGVRHHAAYDWMAPPGTPIRSPVAGTVVEVTPSRGNSGQIFGGVVKVQEADGKVWVFRHVDPANVTVGEQVAPGAPLAGVTDWADSKTGDHTHIELWKTLGGGYRYGNMLDPLGVLRRLLGTGT